MLIGSANIAHKYDYDNSISSAVIVLSLPVDVLERGTGTVSNTFREGRVAAA